MENGQLVDGQETWRRRHGQKHGAGGREGVGSVLPSPGIPSQSPRGLRTCPGAGRRLNSSKLGPEKDVYPESSPRQPPRRSGPDGGDVSQAGPEGRASGVQAPTIRCWDTPTGHTSALG